MFKITYHEKILLGKLVDAYYMANLSDAQPDGKDFWMDLSSELCSTVCMPLEQAMRAILKAYSWDDISDWIGGGMNMNAVEVFADPDDDLDPIQGIRLPKSS
tara:strand:- start:777 stop:1082 length:306 start_codon:yes stop_codon:yes gene_type:complete